MDAQSISNSILNNVRHIIKDNAFDKLNTVCSVLKIVRNNDEINFAYILTNKNVKSNIQLISIGNSLVSKDGEARYNFIDISTIDTNSKLFIAMKEYAVSMIDKNYISIKYTRFIYENNDNTKAYDLDKLHYKGMYLDIYVTTLILELCNDIYGLDESHINARFKMVFLSPFDTKYFLKVSNPDGIKEFMDMITSNMSSSNLEIIQKVIPLKYSDLKNYDKLITHTGKELLINRIVSNMKYSSVGNGFALMVNWFFISNTSSVFYNNESIIHTLKNNRRTVNAVKYLNKTSAEILEISADDKLGSIYKKIGDIRQNIECTHLYMDVSMCILLERVGITLFSAVEHARNNNPIMMSKIGDMFNNPDIFAKYLFNIINSVYILNLNGIIHGDLHLNNATITIRNSDSNDTKIGYDLSSVINSDHLKYLTYENKNPTNVYKNSSEDFKHRNMTGKAAGDKFVFTNHNNNYSAIIDYSRSFIYINDNMTFDIYERQNLTSRKHLRQVEEQRFKHDLKKLFPILETDDTLLNSFFKKGNFAKFYIIYSAIDVFKLTASLIKYISSEKIKINKESMELLINISKFCYSRLEALLDKDFFGYSDQQFPNYQILMKFFSKYKVDDLTDPKIVDIFSINNIMRQYDYFGNENKSGITSSAGTRFKNDSSNKITKFINDVLNPRENVQADELSQTPNASALTISK